MKRMILVLMVTLSSATVYQHRCVAAEAVEPTQKIVLFDGKSMSGWVRYLKDAQADVDKTWSVKADGVLSCSGSPAGYIRTEQSYKNYKLHLEYRWTAKPGNSGVLVHITGEDKVWPKCLECQGQYQNQGDFYEIGGVEFNELKAGGHRASSRRVVKFGKHNEKEPGQWNIYEVWCVGDTVRPYVNGKLMNEATGCSLSEGKIGFQSEGAPLEFRNINIEPVAKKPWPVKPKSKIDLFNGKDLDGWVRFIGPPKKDEKDTKEKPDVNKIWTIADGVIRCEGKPYGYIRTVESYADYKLHLEWRWPEKPTNSGVLLHKTGIDRVWPKCVESQLQNQNAGDFWLIGQSTLMVDGKKFGPKDFANVKRQKPSSEKPAGQWNSYDIICDGKSVTLYVNDVLQNKGTDANIWYGPICLQSEGSPIEFRNIYLEPIRKKR